MTHFLSFVAALYLILLDIIIGEVGSASKMNLVLQLMMGVAVAGVAEGMALADRAGLQQRDVLEIFELTTLSCPLLLEKGKGKIFT
jgi:3-hydroxyisobutyrate dehydrogenase-like beta-hydroxyacid dehydrogenase